MRHRVSCEHGKFTTKVEVSELEGKVVGLYFSANWYPPCRNFTQILIDAYEHLNSNGYNFEVVFVSSDEDLNAFNNYRALMPWLSIPFSDLETKKALDRKFNVEGKTVGLFFSAQWCRPGVKFTPKLVSIYHKIKQMLTPNANDEDFEIVFVSSDCDQPGFDSYFNTMPWLALPFGDPTIKSLTKHFDVQGIPCLIILGPDGKTITKHGRSLINLYQENAYPFTEAKVDLLEKQMDEEAKNLPRSEYHAGHKHELTLVCQETGGGPFICCDCDEQGSGWAYQCLDCGYEVHPKCIRAVDFGSMLEK
ncbi:hypothetical protein GH714_006820 [Hevea brasiliensis]|uniref:protein-disulfide reductase n=1 Tax=Hevea brasiliensis TaxID=3981 RepID=A0A6A6LCF0_HEVBR|nr:hypothetical protein GH714_006820 [Hevea brasiliensis]